VVSTVTVVFLASDGSRREVEAKVGASLMQSAKLAGVAAIEAECGGSCACATCHVYVDPQWLDRIGGPTETEAVTIEFANGVEATSRLSCQIQVTAEMDGLIVRTPAGQH
jgi:2Fe-2S ferredoxin